MENGSLINGKDVFNDNAEKLECFRSFDGGNKGFLNAEDLHRLVASVVKSTPKSFPASDLLEVFDRSQDGNGKIDSSGFDRLWTNFLKPLLHPVTALLVIDVQNDFIDGTLALKNCPPKEDGKDVIPIINNLINTIDFDVVIYSLDSHPDDHISFHENVGKRKLCESVNTENIKPFDVVTFEGPPNVTQQLWPKHCVAGSWGAMLHPELKIRDNSVFVYKGTNPTVDSYSAFWDNMKLSHTNLHEELQSRNVTHVFVCGLAFDYCVSYTALDAVELGYATSVVQDAVRSTDLTLKENMKDKLISTSCVMVTSNEVDKLVEGEDVRLEFAMILKNQIGNRIKRDT